MLDLKFLRKNLELVQDSLEKRQSDLDIDDFKKLDEQRRELIQQVEELKMERNQASQQVATMKREKKDVSDLIDKLSQVSDTIKSLDNRLKEVDTLVQDWIMGVPNIPHSSVPYGLSENDNQEIRQWGDTPAFDFTPKEHWELGTALGGLDFERSAKMTGARFALYWGWAARLERALVSFMLDVQTGENGYTEVMPPVIVNRDSLVGTGQLPKFSEDLFKLEGWEYFLIPTAEVPVTNIHREETLSEDDLPLAYCAYTPCFRSEAGSYGKDTKGLIRQHQFNKVELVRFAHPDDSYEQLETLLGHAESILQKLGLPYRIITLCTGDLGFGSAKTYDIEVWLPGQDTFREISSCSNFEDFQARRANIRFKPKSGKSRLAHTLNGSGLAVGRCLVAILENYQQADGSVIIPEALRKYMGGLASIKVPE